VQSLSVHHLVQGKQQQAAVLMHNKPCPRVAHRSIARFLEIDQKFNKVVLWSLHTFNENFMQIGPAVFLEMLLTKKLAS